MNKRLAAVGAGTVVGVVVVVVVTAGLNKLPPKTLGAAGLVDKFVASFKGFAGES